MLRQMFEQSVEGVHGIRRFSLACYMNMAVPVAKKTSYLRLRGTSLAFRVAGSTRCTGTRGEQ